MWRLLQAQADAVAASKAMSAAMQKAAAAKGECTAWKLRLDSTLGVLGSTADAVARLTSGALRAADALTSQHVQVVMCAHHKDEIRHACCPQLVPALHAGLNVGPATGAAAPHGWEMQQEWYRVVLDLGVVHECKMEVLYCCAS